jgi:hypothetical protein
MGRVMGFLALAAVIGIVTGLALHRVIVGMLVGAGVLLLGAFLLIGRADDPGPVP